MNPTDLLKRTKGIKADSKKSNVIVCTHESAPNPFAVPDLTKVPRKNAYKCKLCSRSFRRELKLSNHIKIHDTSKVNAHKS